MKKFCMTVPIGKWKVGSGSGEGSGKWEMGSGFSHRSSRELSGNSSEVRKSLGVKPYFLFSISYFLCLLLPLSCTLENNADGAATKAEAVRTTPISALTTAAEAGAIKVGLVETAKPAAVTGGVSQEEYPASNLIDGDIDTIWTATTITEGGYGSLLAQYASHQDVSITDVASDIYKGYRHWVTIDLGSVHPRLSKFVYYPRNTGGDARIVDIKVYASETIDLNINAPLAVEAGKAVLAGNATGWDSTGNNDARPAIEFESLVSARYIHIRADQTGFTPPKNVMSIGEINLYEKDAAGNETMIDWSDIGASAHSCCGNSGRATSVASNAIDEANSNNGEDWFISCAIAGDSGTTAINPTDRAILNEVADYEAPWGYAHWLAIDAGEGGGSVYGIRLHRRRDGLQGGNIADFDIYSGNSEPLTGPDLSTKGAVKIKSVTGLPVTALSAESEDWQIVAFDQPVSSRYFQIRVLRDQNMTDSSFQASLAEVELITSDFAEAQTLSFETASTLDTVFGLRLKTASSVPSFEIYYGGATTLSGIDLSDKGATAVTSGAIGSFPEGVIEAESGWQNFMFTDLFSGAKYFQLRVSSEEDISFISSITDIQILHGFSDVDFSELQNAAAKAALLIATLDKRNPSLPVLDGLLHGVYLTDEKGNYEYDGAGDKILETEGAVHLLAREVPESLSGKLALQADLDRAARALLTALAAVSKE